MGLIDNVSGVAVARNGGPTEFYVVRRGFTNVEAQVFRSSAPGAWAELAGFPTGARRCSIATANVDPPVVYVLSANDNGGYHGINRYNLGRAAPIPWETTTDGPSDVFGSGEHQQGGYDQGLVVDPNGPDTCYVAGSGKTIGGEFSATIYRVEIEADGGPNRCSHTSIGGGAHADVHALVFKPGSSSELWAGTDGGVWRTTEATGPSRDSRVHLAERRAGHAHADGPRAPPHRGRVPFCGAQDNGGLRYQGDEVWDHQLPGDGGATVIDWNTGERLLNIYIRNTIRRASTDGARYDDPDVGPSRREARSSSTRTAARAGAAGRGPAHQGRPREGAVIGISATVCRGTELQSVISPLVIDFSEALDLDPLRKTPAGRAQRLLGHRSSALPRPPTALRA